ncbi:hypothetical protein [Chromobacterium phragmitis]|uniref:hypothetical protein n=1 Tax=Chromobacterium phragmitis TaxID=2202141 RepID=UPI0011AE4E61|nr:hypothetical protein [Chromobacterium phragmitis]
MKSLFATVMVSVFLLTSCSESVKQEVKPETVLSALKKAGIPIAKEVVYTAETDSNKLLGRPNQYVAKANWADGRLSQPQEDMAGGTVEIFKSEDDLKARKEYVERIGKTMPMMAQYQYHNGLVLIRLDKALTPTQAAEYEKALHSI